jgi:molybdopterin synthase catalytic subunit
MEQLGGVRTTLRRPAESRPSQVVGHLSREPIDIAEWHRSTIDERGGAAVEFLGIVRGEEGGQPIAYLDYEAYEPMAERVIARLVEQATARWALHQVYVRHRIGRVPVGDVAVVVGVQAPHRDEAFAACRFLIEAIKQDAPIWKQAPNPDAG